MQFDGEELKNILAQQSAAVAIHNRSGFLRGEALEPLFVLKGVDLKLYVGIGNRRRIRYLRPLAAVVGDPWRGGSHTTYREPISTMTGISKIPQHKDARL